tara:strand:- start:48486 stop:49526 length:1041 start_codon:yes stop_codon:yes gene_type:complete
MVPLKIVPRLFVFDEDCLPADLRAQRILSRARVPQIASYLSENWDDYILSSLCASVDGELTFVPANDDGHLRNVGTLSFPMDARILLNDGQHRRAAIEEALKTRPELENETLSVVIFADRGLSRSQQMFADLNKNAVRPSGSLNVLFDHRNPLARLSSRVFEEVPFFQRYLELERTTLSNRTTKLYTLSSLNQAHDWLAGSTADRFGPDTESLVIQFWNALYGVMEDWKLLDAGVQNTADLRQNTVHSHGVMLQAFGLLGAAVLSQRKDTWMTELESLSQLNWSRRNLETWDGRVLNGQRINGQKRAVLLGAGVLFSQLGLQADERMVAAEESLQKERMLAEKEPI